MVKIPFNFSSEIVKAMAAQGKTSSSKTRVLFDDEELFGPMELPKSFFLGKGQILKLAAYGRVQVSMATLDSVHCTKEINEELYDEYRKNPPTSDVDFRNDPAAGRISASVPRDLPLSSCAVRKAAAKQPKPNFRAACPKPGGNSGNGTPSKFL